MIEDPRITELPSTDTAFIPITVERARMPEVFEPAVEELVAALDRQGVEITGPLFAHHLEMRPDTFQFELGFPVAGPVTESGRVRPGKRPAIPVVRTVYHGPYEGLPAAWGAFDAQVEARQLDRAPDIWECYLVAPHMTPDPAAWRTELNRPLRR